MIEQQKQILQSLWEKTLGRVLSARFILGWMAVLLGLGLRLVYASHAGFYVDEYTTIWAADRILTFGLPQFPTGAIYTQGLIYTYLEAVALIFGKASNPLQARLPSLLLSGLTLVAAVYVALRLFRTGPLGLAAFWLAIDSQAIVWGGRVRTYALLQLLVLLAFLAWYQGAVADDRPRSRWLAIGLLLAALVDQPLILLLLPPLALAALIARGWTWLQKPLVWLQAGVMAIGVGSRLFLYQLLVPSGAIVTSEARRFLDLLQPFVEWENLFSFFTEPLRLGPTLLLTGALIWLLFRFRSHSGTWQRPVLTISFVLTFVMLEMLLVVGTTWRNPRYLYPFLPLLFLGGEGVLIPGLRGLAQRATRLSSRWVVVGLTTAVVILSIWLTYPTAYAAATRNEWGYDQAMDVVAEGWLEDDALATIVPLAAFLHLGDCDYLAIEEEGKASVVETNGTYLDSWTGLPLLDSPERLVVAMGEHPHLWFVADEMRLNRHFSAEFLQLLWARSDLVAFEYGAFVFRSRPFEPEPEVDRSLEANFAGQLSLEGYRLSKARPQPGEVVTVTLRWKPLAPRGEYIAFVHLIDRTGRGIVGHDAPPLGGLYPPHRWQRSPRSQPFPDRHQLELPSDLPAGYYRIDVGLYRPGTLKVVGERRPLDFLSVGESNVDLSFYTPVARFGDAAKLWSGGVEGKFKSGGVAHLRLAWQTGPLGFDADYTLFLHLVDGEGNIVQQWDAPPDGGWYPTSYWKAGEVIADERDLMFSPMLVPGRYRLVAGLYARDGTRLALTNPASQEESDSVELAIIELAP